MSPRTSHSRVHELWRTRPRSPLLRGTALVLGLWTLYSWLSPEIAVGEFLTPRRWTNLRNFVSGELLPYPLRGPEGDPGELGPWLRTLWAEVGAESTLATLQISVLAIAIAALLAFPLATLSARNFATSTPFESDTLAGRSWREFTWTLVRRGARGLAILMRAIPEYILAFLLLAVLGPRNAWPAVLALAIHNGGILGRLGGEVIENVEPAPLRALSSMGSPRGGTLIFGLVPLTLGRHLLYFFYRFETCVREATVLGMLGVVSLGYWIQDARAKQYYDEMLLLVLCGSGLVLLADLISALARRSIRNG